MGSTIQTRGPRKHHYVPKCWLAGFTETGQQDGRLWVTDLLRQDQWPSSPINAGHIRDYYRVEGVDPDPNVVERFFSTTVEDAVAPVLRALDRERRPPDEDELEVLLQMMAFQWVRVPAFKPFARRVTEQFVRSQIEQMLHTPDTWRAGLVRAGMDPDAPGADFDGMRRFLDSGQWNITAETEWYLQRAFAVVPSIFESLRQRYWGISFTERGRLIASDNPVVLDGDRGTMVGFRDAPIVLYPLSRHALLVSTPERIGRPIENFNHFVQTNTIMLLRAEAQVYSHIENFSWLDENRTHQTDWRMFDKSRF